MEQITQSLPVIHLSDLNPSASASNDLASSIVDAVLAGYVNPLDFPVKKKCIEQALEAALKNTKVKDAIMVEIKKYGKFATHMGAKLEIVEAGVTYDFTNCNDSELLHLEEQLSIAAEALKSRKDFLKTVPKDGITVVSTVTGEVETIFPPSKSSTTTIKTTMK